MVMAFALSSAMAASAGPGRWTTAGCSSACIFRAPSPSPTCRTSRDPDASDPQSRLAQKPIGRCVGLTHPVDDLVRLWRVFQLDADGAVDAKLLDLLQIGAEVDDASAGRQVA